MSVNSMHVVVNNFIGLEIMDEVIIEGHAQDPANANAQTIFLYNNHSVLRYPFIIITFCKIIKKKKETKRRKNEKSIKCIH